MTQCSNTHADVTCDQVEGNHSYCLGWSQVAGEPVYWANPNYEAPKIETKRSARRKLTEMAARVPPAVSVHDQPR
jgi:hypothetical protein